ncbi:type I polyketide synthase [Streptomyces sp. NPDC017086]|uniref:type I polyketide synthase n=1 Tax=Streptomyces sp. NPDC017086 TaxID=3364976 RepID=UPI003788AA3A
MNEYESRQPEEPIAIIGMSCRFAPDLTGPALLWESLLAGRGSVGEMPAKRWDPYAAQSPDATAVLRRTTRKGMYLDDIEGFDAEFFRITPREAEYLDPQQRILLELAWEALEDAGVPPLSLSGTGAGVYMSANSNDYGRRLLEDLSRTGAWAVNGTTFYGMANRISYFLDVKGPSMAVDTACAGSLTALHVACQGLRLGEAPVALVGGVNIIASPALNVALDAAGATSPDGRSKAFDRAADGYGRGEGAGVVVLKRLSDARRDGDPVRGLVIGSGVYQDGRSDGMMAPSGAAQEHMLREIYARARISPRSVDYVEAHGTGTQAGDRAEIHALAAVFGAGRTAGDPCLVGTLKPNIGHVEAASGIAGVIKTVLAMEHRALPPSVHREPDPELGFGDNGLRLLAETTQWPAHDGPRRAGVSSYGVGGTISHVILQEPPNTETAAQPSPAGTAAEPSSVGTAARPAATAGAVPEPAATAAVTVEEPAAAATVREPVAGGAGPATAGDAGPRVFPLSAMSDAGVRDLAGAVAGWLRAHPGAAPDAVAHTLAHRRSHLDVRAAVVAGTGAELAAALDVLAAGGRAPEVVTGRALPAAEGPVWVFSGHGAQWTGMGRDLLRDEPVFARAVDALAGVFQEELGWTPRQVIEDGGPWTVTVVQAMTFAVQVALAETWTARGLVPKAVIGHSVGEIAACVAAGALDPADAARFACRRARALGRIAGRGGMALVGEALDDVEQHLEGWDGLVAAICASPRSTVVSGDADAIGDLVTEWTSVGIEVRRVDTDVAFHSPHVDEVLDEVTEAARQLTARTPHTTLYSSALTDPRGTAPRAGDYWRTNLRAPVRFAQAVTAAVEDGHRVFLEVSSHPVVAQSVRETAEHLGVDDLHVAVSMRRDTPGVPTLLRALAELHCHGVAVRWPGRHGELLPLPTTRWQHRPYWIFPESPAESHGRGHDPDTHTLLGGRMTVAGSPAQQVWQTHLDMDCRPYAQSHKVVGVETVPASVVLHTFVTAATDGDRRPGLRDIVFRTPLAAQPPRVVQIVLDQNQARLASCLRRDAGDDAHQELEWLTHTTATVDRGAVVGARPLEDVQAIRDRCPEEWTWTRVDTMFRNMGVDGYTFPWVVTELRRNDREQLATVVIDHEPKLHPSSWTAVIDGALTVSGVLVTKEDATSLRTSSHIEAIAYRGDPPPRITVHTVRSATDPDTTIDVRIADDSGQVVCEVTGLRYTVVQDRPGGIMAPRELVHEIAWRPVEAKEGVRPARLLLLGAPAVTEALARDLGDFGVRCRRLASATEIAELSLDEPGVLLVAPPRQLPDETPEEAAERCSWSLIEAVQALGRRLAERPDPDTESPLRLWCLTQGVRHPGRQSSLAHAPLWGISRITAGERTDLWGGVLDVDAELSDFDGDTPARVLRVLSALPGAEDVVSLTKDGVFVARLTRIDRPAGSGGVRCRPDGTYLITGGVGALGLEVARSLVERGARRLVLAGRGGLPPRSGWDRVEDPAVRRRIDAVLALEALGATVRVLALDIADADRVAAALDPSALDLPPIRGVVHAAGVVADALVDHVDRAGLHQAMAPKMLGAMNLHRMFPPGTLDFMVFFSSCGQLARLTGQASYAAANSFLDGLAAYRGAQGATETVSLAWTSWRGAGMAETTAGTTTIEAESRGLGSISIAEAFRAWSFADRFDSPYYAVLRVLPERRLPVFSELTSAAEDDAAVPGGAVDWFSLTGDELAEQALAEVNEQVAAELNLPAADIDANRPLVDLGVDSVLTVGLRVRLNRRFGIDLPPTILWSNPTVASLAGFLAQELARQAAETAQSAETAETTETAEAATVTRADEEE